MNQKFLHQKVNRDGCSSDAPFGQDDFVDGVERAIQEKDPRIVEDQVVRFTSLLLMCGHLPLKHICSSGHNRAVDLLLHVLTVGLEDAAC